MYPVRGGDVIQPDDQDRYHPLTGDPILLSRILAAEQYASMMLPYIPRGLPVFQSHGIHHSLRIIRLLNQIFRAPGIQILRLEAFLLYVAAWFHDIGYLNPLSIHNRSMHPSLSVEMIHKDTGIQSLLQGDEGAALDIIIRNHDTRTDLTGIRESGSSLRTPLLAALFRIADAFDIGTDRCPVEVFSLIEDGLDEHSRRHWLAHQNIAGCSITPPIITVMVNDPENPFFKRRIVPHLEEDCLTTSEILRRYGITPFMPVYRQIPSESRNQQKTAGSGCSPAEP